MGIVERKSFCVKGLTQELEWVVTFLKDWLLRSLGDWWNRNFPILDNIGLNYFNWNYKWHHDKEYLNFWSDRKVLKIKKLKMMILFYY